MSPAQVYKLATQRERQRVAGHLARYASRLAIFTREEADSLTPRQRRQLVAAAASLAALVDDLASQA